MKKVVAVIVVAGTAVAANGQVINEFNANHTGSDTNEYFEFYGQPNTDYSHLTIVGIEGDSGQTGLIDDETFQIGTTDSNGYWWTGYQNNVLENGTVTYLLVDGYFGSLLTDIDTNDDGIIDSPQWTSILDGIGVYDGGGSDLNYTAVVLAAFFDGESFSPGGASRIPNGFDSDSISDWMRNDFDGAGIPALDPGTLGSQPGEVLNTPGTENVIPVPGTLALLGLGGLAIRRRR